MEHKEPSEREIAFNDISRKLVDLQEPSCQLIFPDWLNQNPNLFTIHEFHLFDSERQNATEDVTPAAKLLMSAGT